MTQPCYHFAAIGECMIELNPLKRSRTLAFSGDKLNTTVYFARCSDLERVRIHYATAVGDDPYSQQMLQQWMEEGIQTDCARQIPGKLPGLYLIHNDAQGEREFYYYRSQAAAREMFHGTAGQTLYDQLLQFNMFYLSSISLAILYEAGRTKLIDLLQCAHAEGKTICFDTNYRPRLWSSPEAARDAITQILPFCHIALPSFEDEQQLFGDPTPAATADRLHQAGIAEVVVKQGEQGYLLSDSLEKQQIRIDPVSHVVDATAAGDAFNGAYLAARLQGLEPTLAAKK